MGFDSSTTCYSDIEVESVLRLRPLLNKESEDSIILEKKKYVVRNGPATVVLHPLHPSLVSPTSHRQRADFDGAQSNTPTDFHFNHVLDENTSQDKIYYTLGLPLATAAMSSLKNKSSYQQRSPRNHLLVCMGVVNSGKSYTCIGGKSVSVTRKSNEGLVPRLVDSFFSQSQHHSNNGSKGFALQVSVIQVTHAKGSDPHACQVQDLFAVSTKSGSPKKSPAKRHVTVSSIRKRFEQAIPSPIRSPLKSTEFEEVELDNPNPTVENCSSAKEARQVLQKGLEASKKAAKGRNFHILITMQPVLNGSQLGDKISILDMAGLEKDKRGHSRGKDSVANKNQAANAAVLHCLRTLIHNTNIRNGTSSPLDIHCVDDMASEISCVSQEKDRMHDDEKPVPFRQHKVSMLLQPLFATPTTTKVTILMTAYPGHSDHQEKRLLLQDMELLHGASLISAPSTVATGFESRSVMSSESDPRLSSDSRSDDESVDHDPLPTRRADPVRTYDTSRLKSRDTSVTNDSTKAMRRQPPAFAPSFRNLSSLDATAPPAEMAPVAMAPSAPSAPPLEDYSKSISSNPHSASDFPGIAIPASDMRNSPRSAHPKTSRVVVNSDMAGGRRARAPPFYDESQNNSLPSPTSKARDARAPLGRSSLENGSLPAEPKRDTRRSKYVKEVKSVPKTEVRYGGREQRQSNDDDRSWTKESKGQYENPLNYQNSKVLKKKTELHQSTGGKDQRWTKESKDQCENPLNHSNLRVRVDRGYTKEASQQQESPNERIRKMALQIKGLLEQKQALEQKCNELERENKKLKVDVREAGRSKLQAQWTNQDEEEFLESRRIRREEQSLVKGPLMAHMDRVNYIYDIKNQHFVSNKPQFELALPRHFQRAPELDIRDKKIEEMQRNEENVNPAVTSDMPPPVKLTFESSSRNKTPPRATSNIGRAKRKAANNSSMSALKMLAAGR